MISGSRSGGTCQAAAAAQLYPAIRLPSVQPWRASTEAGGCARTSEPAIDLSLAAAAALKQASSTLKGCAGKRDVVARLSA